MKSLECDANVAPFDTDKASHDIGGRLLCQGAAILRLMSAMELVDVPLGLRGMSPLVCKLREEQFVDLPAQPGCEGGSSHVGNQKGDRRR